jgi:hypothetical protein
MKLGRDALLMVAGLVLFSVIADAALSSEDSRSAGTAANLRGATPAATASDASSPNGPNGSLAASLRVPPTARAEDRAGH